MFMPIPLKESKQLNPVKVGILGLGTVGGGTINVLSRNAEGVPLALVRQPFMARMQRFIIMELLIHHLELRMSISVLSSTRKKQISMEQSSSRLLKKLQ